MWKQVGEITFERHGAAQCSLRRGGGCCSLRYLTVGFFIETVLSSDEGSARESGAWEILERIDSEFKITFIAECGKRAGLLSLRHWCRDTVLYKLWFSAGVLYRDNMTIECTTDTVMHW